MRPELVANYYSYIALIPIMDDTWQKFVYPLSLHFKIKIYWKFEIMWCFKYWYYLEPQVNLFPVPPQFPPITTYTARRSWANRWRATHVHKIFPPIILPISPSSLIPPDHHGLAKAFFSGTRLRQLCNFKCRPPDGTKNSLAVFK